MNNANFFKGVAIIAKYVDPSGYDLNAEHDKIWFGAYAAVTDEADIKQLIDLGWREEYDSWSCFT